MNRVTWLVVILSGLVAGAVGAETVLDRAPRPMFDTLLVPLVIAAVSLALAGVALWDRRRSGTPATSRGAVSGEVVRRRVLALAAEGTSPERIAREMNLPRDIVTMALRAFAPGNPAPAGSAAPRARGPRLSA